MSRHETPPAPPAGSAPAGAEDTPSAVLGALFRALVEHSSDVLAVLAADGTLTYQSPALARVMGWRPDELVGRPALELVHPDDAERVAAAIAGSFSRPGVPVSVTYRYRHADGHWVDLTSIGTNHLDDPAVRGIVVNSRDVSAERRAAEELARLAHVTRSIGDFVLITDREGRIQWVNEAFLARTGWAGAELLGQPARVLLSASNRPGLTDEIRAVREAGGFRGDVLNATKEGEEFWVSLTTSVLKRGEEVLGLVAVSREITDRKRAEAELTKAKEEAERANRAKSEFLANMSHEIRTPMNAVIGMTGLLLETPLSAEQRDFVETIRTSGDALLTILNDILDFSKMESGRLELERQPFDPRDVVDESIDLLAPRAAEKGLELTAVVGASVPAAVVGDVTRVRQVLVNLLSNAVKFTAEGSVSVVVTARPLPEGETEISVEVRDTGIGIPPHRRARLFRPFSQIDASMSRQYGGTGLGLAICARLCELMGGAVGFDSEPGKGSAFRFTVRCGVLPGGEPEPAPAGLAGKRLLVAEGRPESRRSLAMQAQVYGVHAAEAATLEEALRLLSFGDRYDAALVDRDLGGDGLAAAGRVKAARPGLPVVLIAPVGRREADAEALPGVPVLTRPVKGRQLFRALTGLDPESSGTRRKRTPEVPFEADLARRHPLRVLVAEDNPVNQKVALHLLSHLGYRADVAGNGLEVLEAVRRQPYDVVLLDVQMPEMDGFEAARWLGREWPDGKRPRLVAMTANAMKGDREACLAAGMDDYVSKPVQAVELATALLRARKVAREAPPVTSATGPLDPTAIEKLRRLQRPGEPDVVTELVDLFLSDAPSKLAALERAASEGSLAALKRTAHALKTSAGSLGAVRMAALCALIEGAVGLEAASEPLPRLAREMARVAEALARERRG